MINVNPLSIPNETQRNHSGYEHLPLLRASGLWFNYDHQGHAVEGVHLEIKPGWVTMILGRSGSGKTTLLKLLGNILKPVRGEIQIFKGMPNEKIPVAYIPQSLGLVRNMTTLDNTLMGALGYTGTFRSLAGFFPKEVKGDAQRILTDLGLWDKRQRKIFHLSGGERQRVAIARALMRKPSLILADEFVSQLDPVTALEVLTMVRTLARGGISLLITTHDVGLVTKYADRLIIMMEGRIIYDDAPTNIPPEEMLELMR